ncbi:hypothetical protein QUF63_17655 [Anaerolineales bacterium HSG25]|nr:hypothetical protein [Anaerolineales bacterium HSG25]
MRNEEWKDSLLRGAKLLGGVWSQEQDLRGEKHTSEDAESFSSEVRSSSEVLSAGGIVTMPKNINQYGAKGDYE